MIALNYKLTKDIIARTANQLNWNLQKIPCSIEIINQEGRKVNAKSLIGLLSGQFRKDNEVKVVIGDITKMPEVKSCLSEVGREEQLKG